MKPKQTAFVSLLLGITLLFKSVNGQDHSDNWPQWRGANLDSIASDAADLPVKFDKATNMAWRFALPGPGGSSPVVFGDRIFVTSASDSDGLVLICLDTTGKELWKKTLQGSNRQLRMDAANFASASPCTDGEHVWATTGAGFLECFDYDGNNVWNTDLQKTYGKFKIQFGMSSTPVLDDGVLYLQLIHGNMRDRRTTSTGKVLALDAKTGKERWQQDRETDGIAENKHSYASPTLVKDGANQYLVSHGGDYVIGHALDDGRELWRCGGINPKGRGYNPFLRFVSSPVFVNSQLIVPSAKNGPVFCMKTNLSGDVSDDDSAFIWKLDQGTPDVATPVVANGLVFLARENGVLSCFDEKSGEQVFQKRIFADKHRSTPVFAEGRLYVLGRDGTVTVVSADRKAEVLAENSLGETGKASPAIVGNRIYIRTDEAVYCFVKKS